MHTKEIIRELAFKFRRPHREIHTKNSKRPRFISDSRHWYTCKSTQNDYGRRFRFLRPWQQRGATLVSRRENPQTDVGINPIRVSISKTKTTIMPIEMRHFNTLKSNPRTSDRMRAPTSRRSRVKRLTMQRRGWNSYIFTRTQGYFTSIASLSACVCKPRYAKASMLRKS